MDKIHDQNKGRKRKRKNHRRRVLIALLVITLLVWGILLTAVIIADLQSSDGKSIGDIFKTVVRNVADNMLGILPPILLFDFTLEFLTQEDSAEELSEQVTSALMGNSDTLDLFNKEAKRAFLNATITSLCEHDEESVAAATAALEQYFLPNRSIRKDFVYQLRLYRFRNFNCYFTNHNYWCLSERLAYKQKSTSLSGTITCFKVGFFVKNSLLDTHLHCDDFLFREALSVLPEDLEILSKLTNEEQERFIIESFCLSVEVNEQPCSISRVDISECGIVVDMQSRNEFSNRQFEFAISFCIPQLFSILPPIYVTYPTHNVRVELAYPPDYCDVLMAPFFDSSDGHLVERSDKMKTNGLCGVEIQGWVSPMSGIAFTVTELSGMENNYKTRLEKHHEI